jgi:cyclohexanone monooxygenase
VSEVYCDVVIVGAGFAGLYALHRLRGLGYKCLGFEAGEDVGGTWYWNRYPGAACDIESLEYSYSFSEDLQQEWSWSQRFARQPEILAYMNHVADRFDLRRDFEFNTRVEAAHFDDATGRWTVSTDTGRSVSAKYCIMATGCLSAPKPVEYPGLERFKGEVYHTAYWPKEPVDFRGKRVGVIGTGSSAIQSIPIIAQDATSLHVFQRTPNFSVPAGNAPMDRDFEKAIKADYKSLRRKERNSVLGIDMILPQDFRTAASVSSEERREEYERRWAAGGLYFYTSFVDLLVDPASNESLAEFAREKIRAKVKDPKTAELLCPKDHPFGTKRICADTNYFETFNNDHVHLVDVRSNPIIEFTEAGIRTSAAEYDLD